MLPVFHAGGRHLYARAAHIYLQDMEALDVNKHEKFITEGYWTIRRSSKYWCGIPSDQAVECGVMKLFKHPKEGLTHGKGTDEEDLARWILSLPIFIKILQSFEDYSSVSFATSEQHKSKAHEDGSRARIKKDNEDLNTIFTWLEEHFPFGNCN